MYNEIEEGEYIDEEDVDNTEQIEEEQSSTSLRKMPKNRKPIKPPEIEEDDNDDDEVLRQKLLENLMKSQTRKQLAESSESSNQSPKRIPSSNNKLSCLISQLDSAYKRRDSYLRRRRDLQELVTICDLDLERINETINKLINKIYSDIQSVAKQQKKQQKQKINKNIKNKIKKILPQKERKSTISRLPIPTRKRKNLSDISIGRKVARIFNEGEDLDLRELIPSKAIDIIGQLQPPTEIQQSINPSIEDLQQNQHLVPQLNSITETPSIEIISKNKNISPNNISLEEGEIGENDESIEEQNLPENSVDQINLKENKMINNKEFNDETILIQNEKLKGKEILIEMDNNNTTSIVPEFSDNLEEQDDETREESSTPPPQLPLLNIRLYRLSPNFPQHLLSHPAFSSHLNPFTPLCPFQLNGRCADKHCVFQHEQDYILNEKQIVEEFLTYWPKLVPKGMKNSDYATKMLAEGPLDQVLGFLMASMPDDVRICLNLFSGKYLEYSQSDRQIHRDDQIEYEPLTQGAVGQPKGWMSLSQHRGNMKTIINKNDKKKWFEPRNKNYIIESD
uniref:C3H1-type domain-containing protein n=1 Tax=Meloidogyne hapla TaxID=6305 RepID=A0A1I8BG31_MELHA